MYKLKNNGHIATAFFFVLALFSPPSFSTEIMDGVAMRYISTLTPEDQSSIGIKEMRSRGRTVYHNHNTAYLEQLKDTRRWYQGVQDSFEGSELHKRELSLHGKTLDISIALVQQMIDHKYVTVLSTPKANLLNPADTIFDYLNDLVLIKASMADISARFRFYVYGDAMARPFIVAVQEETEKLMDAYGAEGRYPYIKQLENIADVDKFTAILDGLKALLPEEPDAIAEFHTQMNRYLAFVNQKLIPRAAKTPGLPRVIYELRLKLYGVDDSPEQLIERGLKEFEGPYQQYKFLANQIAAQKADPARFPQDDPAGVLNELIKDLALQDTDAIIAMYRRAQGEIEQTIRDTDFVTLPQRPVVVRPGTDAEEAIMPIPHVNGPNFVNNDGTVWPEFVLCDLKGCSDPLCAYPLTAHEGRPGHDLQFSRMLELTLKGEMNLFESVLSDNATNVEGWAHYVEYAMSEHFPPEVRLSAMRDQLLRMARTFLDPQINLGLISHEDVVRFQRDKVGYSGQTPKSEADRYSFKYPGQAVSYRFGAQRIMDLRDKLKVKMGDQFSLGRFHDALLSFGLLPVNLVADFIEERM